MFKQRLRGQQTECFLIPKRRIIQPAMLNKTVAQQQARQQQQQEQQKRDHNLSLLLLINNYETIAQSH